MLAPAVCKTQPVHLTMAKVLNLTMPKVLKASHMGHFVMVSLWCASLSTNTRFRLLKFRMKNF